MKAVPLLARTAGLLAHLAEEQRAAARLPDGGEGRGGDRLRALSAELMLAPEVEGRPWAEQLALDDEAYKRAARLPLRPLGLLPREADGGGIRLGRSGGRPRRHRAAAADREARAQGDVHARQPDRRASLRDAVRDRPDLLDERHDRHAELHPAHGERPRQLGDGLGAQLRGLRRHRGPARRVLLQRRAVRRGRGDRGLRPHRPVPHPARHRQHRAPDVRRSSCSGRKRRSSRRPTPRI